MNTWKRTFLALLSVPLLAVPSAVGVYTYLEPESGWFAAGLAAAGFEVLYVGVNILRVTSPELRRYARNVALGAVVVAVLMNSLAHYGAKVPNAYHGAPFDPLAAVLALIASAPLAGLAYAVSVLLHRLSEDDARQQSEVARLQIALTQAESEIAQARALPAPETVDLAPYQAQVAQAQSEIAQRDREIAHLRSELAQPIVVDGIDLLSIARRLRDRGVPSRDAADILGVKDSTLRSRLAKVAQNGAHG